MTIRQHLEAIRDLHYCYDRGVRWACGGCEQNHPCDSYEHAVAALRDLDNAFWHEDLGRSAMCRLVPDPVAAATPEDEIPSRIDLGDGAWMIDNRPPSGT